MVNTMTQMNNMILNNTRPIYKPAKQFSTGFIVGMTLFMVLIIVLLIFVARPGKDKYEEEYSCCTK